LRFLADGLAAAEQSQLVVHLGGGLVTLPAIWLAGFEQNAVQFEQLVTVRQVFHRSGRFRKIEPVFAHAHFVENFPEAEDVRLRRNRSLWRNETLGADVRERLRLVRDQADIGELGDTFDENDVRGFDIAVNQPVPMKLSQRSAE
jgi:hypothetical protein